MVTHMQAASAHPGLVRVHNLAVAAAIAIAAFNGSAGAAPTTCSRYATSWVTSNSTVKGAAGVSYVDSAGTIYQDLGRGELAESSDFGASWTTHALPVTTAVVSQIVGDSAANVYLVAQDYDAAIVYVLKARAGGTITIVDEVHDAVVANNSGGPTSGRASGAHVDATGHVYVALFENLAQNAIVTGNLAVRASSPGGASWTNTILDAGVATDFVYPGGLLDADAEGNLFAISSTGRSYAHANGVWSLAQTLPGMPWIDGPDGVGGVYVTLVSFTDGSSSLWHRTATSTFSQAIGFPVQGPPTIDSTGRYYEVEPIQVSGYENHMVVHRSADRGKTWSVVQTTASGEFVLAVYADGSDNLFETAFLGSSIGAPLAGAQNWLTRMNFAKSDELPYEYGIGDHMFQDTRGNLYAVGFTYNGGLSGVPDQMIIRKLTCLAR